MEQKKILLVEDDYLNRRLSKKVLLENGYTVLEAKNTKEALDILETEQVDIAILDIHLGDDQQNGILLGQQLKDRFSVPFIYLTAYDTPEIIRKAIATHPYSYLTKPLKRIDLIASVEIAIRQAAPTADRRPKLRVKDGNYQVMLPVDEINYIESVGNYLLFHTDTQIYKSRTTIKQILEELSQNTFIQVHRAFIVNKGKVEKFNLKSVVVVKKEIPISKKYAGNFLL